MARLLTCTLALACSLAQAGDADLARLTAAPLSDEDWRAMVASRGSDPAFMARAYRVGCLQRIQAGTALETPAHAEAVRLGLVLAEQLAVRADIAGLLLCRGRLAKGHGQAAADYARALAEAAQAADIGLQVMAIALRGELRHGQSDWFHAQKDLLTAQQLAQRQPDDPTSQHAMLALAHLYADPQIAQYEQAISLYRDLLPRLEARKVGQRLADVRLSLALVYLRVERHDLALIALTEAERAFASVNDAMGAARAKAHRAEVLLRLNEPSQSLGLIDDVLKDRQVRADLSAQHLTRAAALRQLGRLKEAKAALARAMPGPEASASSQVSWAQESAELAAQSGQWQLAYEARSAELKARTLVETQRRDAQQASRRAHGALECEASENLLRHQQARMALHGQRLEWALLVAAGLALVACVAGWRRRKRTGSKEVLPAERSQ